MTVHYEGGKLLCDATTGKLFRDPATGKLVWKITTEEDTITLDRFEYLMADVGLGSYGWHTADGNRIYHFHRAIFTSSQAASPASTGWRCVQVTGVHSAFTIAWTGSAGNWTGTSSIFGANPSGTPESKTFLFRNSDDTATISSHILNIMGYFYATALMEGGTNPFTNYYVGYSIPSIPALYGREDGFRNTPSLFAQWNIVNATGLDSEGSPVNFGTVYNETHNGPYNAGWGAIAMPAGFSGDMNYSGTLSGWTSFIEISLEGYYGF